MEWVDRPHLHQHEALQMNAICRAIVADGCVEGVINLLRTQQLDTPLPLSIWDDIFRDRHVDFPKFLASTSHTYHYADEPIKFAGGFVLIKKHHLAASQPLTSESEWGRMLSAWEQIHH
ncbi:hypothetical protein B0H13DRAFT_1859058 [Mycena leptocephala]|nr:hypothetical protein B0H13DRAFT_1859058 [Mycena leptocephala]